MNFCPVWCMELLPGLLSNVVRLDGIRISNRNCVNGAPDDEFGSEGFQLSIWTFPEALVDGMGNLHKNGFATEKGITR